MGGADWQQQQELEEMQQFADEEGVDIFEFIDGQAAAKDRKPIPITASQSFIRGYRAQQGLDEIR